MAETAVTISAPAKLNLSLAVLARQADGFHAIESLMVPVDLADTLVLRPGGPSGIRLEVRFADQLAGPRARPWPATCRPTPPISLSEACESVAAAAGIEPALEIDLVQADPVRGRSGRRLERRGGGDPRRGNRLGARLAGRTPGRDRQPARQRHPLFLRRRAGGGGRQRRAGHPRAAAEPLAAVIVAPAAGLSTAAVYGSCTPDASRAGDAARLADRLAAGSLPAAMPLMHNGARSSRSVALERHRPSLGRPGKGRRPLPAADRQRQRLLHALPHAGRGPHDRSPPHRPRGRGHTPLAGGVRGADRNRCRAIVMRR